MGFKKLTKKKDYKLTLKKNEKAVKYRKKHRKKENIENLNVCIEKEKIKNEDWIEERTPLDLIEYKIFNLNSSFEEILSSLRNLKKYMFHSEDENNKKIEMKSINEECIQEPINKISEFEQSLDIFKKLVLSPRFSESIVIGAFHNYEIENFIAQIRTQSVKIRIKITRIVQILILKSVKLRFFLKTCIFNEIVFYIENGRNFKHIDVLLDLCTFIVGKDIFENSDEMEEFIINYVIRLFSESNAFWFTDGVFLLFKNICYYGDYFTSIVFDYFLDMFPRSNTPTKTLIMEITFKILNETYKDIEPYVSHVCTYMNHAFKEQNSSLINTTKPLVTSMALRMTLKANIHLILPSIFHNLYQLSKTYWNLDESGHIFEMIHFFMESDRKLFNMCLFDYNKSKYGAFIEQKINEDPLSLHLRSKKAQNSDSDQFERRKSVYDVEFEEHKRMRHN